MSTFIVRKRPLKIGDVARLSMRLPPPKRQKNNGSCKGPEIQNVKLYIKNDNRSSILQK